VAAVTPDELLHAYDDQLRTDAEVARALDVRREGPLLWAVFDHGGFVSYRDLGGLDGKALDDLVERTREIEDRVLAVLTDAERRKLFATLDKLVERVLANDP
jgi:hypothetical protein